MTTQSAITEAYRILVDSALPLDTAHIWLVERIAEKLSEIATRPVIEPFPTVATMPWAAESLVDQALRESIIT